MPALDAFHLYLARPDFKGLKVKSNTFGKGLEAEVLRDLDSPFLDIRQGAIRGLVERWRLPSRTWKVQETVRSIAEVTSNRSATLSRVGL